MSDPVAGGYACPNCGTLVTCNGVSTDAMISGLCPVDGTTVSMVNPSHVAGVAPAAPVAIEATGADATESAQATEIATLESEVATLQSAMEAHNL